MTRVPKRTRLATRLLRRLVWIAVAVMVANIAFVAAYDAADESALVTGVIDRQIRLLDAALHDASLPDLDISAMLPPHFAEHPEAYAYVVQDPQGVPVSGMNTALFVPSLLTNPLFTDDWIVRKTTQDTIETYASHLVDLPAGTYRVFFAMITDPAGLIGAEIRREFFGHVWLPLIPTMVLLIGGTLLILRRDIGPIGEAAAWARNITTEKSALPLDLDVDFDAMPAEIADLTDAVNRAIAGLNAELENEKRRAAEAAHALRTPVAVLVARLDDLPRDPALDQLRADVQMLSRTVTQFLLSAGADRLTLGPGDRVVLRDVAEATVTKLTPWALIKGAEIIFDPGDAAQAVKGSTEAIDLALTNLIENAVHHGASPIYVTVGTGGTIRVEDAGSDLPQAATEQMFKPFWRGADAAKGGAGLGLAIVERIQRAHGGHVKVASTPAGGAIFTLFYVPST